MSKTQLGAQTVFGISLEQSLEAIPAIFAQIREGVPESITDPAKRAQVAIDDLTTTMNKIVVAQRESGASGSDLIQVYAKLASTAKDAGLSQNQLISLSAASAVKLNKSPEETATSISTVIERAYGEGRAPLEKLGIATRQVGEDGTIQFRGFYDILKDVVALIDRVPSKAQEINQALGGQKRIAEAKAIVQSYQEANRIGGALQPTGTGTGQLTGNEYNTLLEKRRQAFQSSLNEIQSSLGLFFEQVLVGNGVLDDLGKTLGNVSNALHSVAEAAKNNPELFNKIKNAIYGAIFAVTTLGLRGLNAFTLLARTVNAISTTIKGFFSGITVGFQSILAPAEGGASAITKVFELMQNSGNNALSSIGRQANEASADLLGVAKSIEAITRNVPGLETVNAALRGVTAPKTVTGVSSFWQTGTGRGIRNAGETLGSLALPALFDVTTNGTGAESIANIGIGIAGGFVGSLLGPQGTIIGYTIARATAQGLDAYGLLGGTSEKEKAAFSTAYGKQIIANKPVSSDVIEQLRTAVAQQSAGEFAIGSGGVAAYQKFQVNKQSAGSFTDLYNKTVLSVNSDAEKKIYDLLQKTGTLDLFKESNVSNLDEFVRLLDSTKDKNSEIGKLVDEQYQQQKAITDAQADQNAQTSKGVALYGTLDDVLSHIKQKIDDVKERNANLFNVPVGLAQFGALGSAQQALNEKYAPLIGDVANKGFATVTNKQGKVQQKLSVEQSNNLLQSYTEQSQLLQGLPAILGAVNPAAQELGLNIDGIAQKLLLVGSNGQSAFKQQIDGLIQAIQYADEYEAIQSSISEIQARPEYTNVSNEGHEQAIAEYQTYQKQLESRKQTYEQYRAYLDLVKSEPDILNKNLDILQRQNQAQRRLVSAGSPGTPGTPATFQAPSLVDVRDYSVDAINKAIQSAREKQTQLSKLSPGYAKQFSEDQFLLSSGKQFQGISGVDQSFFNEALQAQKQQLQAPQTEDLSQFSDVQIQKILEQARGLQAKAVELAPDLKDKYESERILVLRKNNQLLLETGLSQEYLKEAIQDNTKSQDQLRGHYNLPGAYRVPTVFDYYASGGKEAGNINYPSRAGGGVSLDLATKIAEAIANKGVGKAGPDLGQVTGAGAALTYYKGGSPGTPGKPPVYEDIPAIPEITLPKLPLTEAQQEIADKLRDNFTLLKQAQLDALDGMRIHDVTGYDAIENIRTQRANAASPGAKATTDAYNAVENIRVQRTDVTKTADDVKQAGGVYNDTISHLTNTSEYLGNATQDAGDKARAYGQSIDTANQNISNIGSSILSTAGTAINSITSFATDTSGATTAFQSFVRELNTFSLDKLFSQNKVTVNVNGVPVPQAAVTTTTQPLTEPDGRPVPTGGQGLSAGQPRGKQITAY